MTGPRRTTRRELRDLLVKRDGAACRWCGHPVRDPAEVGEKADNAATVDHLLTRREGGDRRDPRNAVLACNHCNRERGCLPVADWRAVLLRRRLARWWQAARLGLRGALGLALVAAWCLWWAPTAGWLFGGLLLDRARFWGVVLLAATLHGIGFRRASRWVYRRALARCARRMAALERSK